MRIELIVIALSFTKIKTFEILIKIDSLFNNISYFIRISIAYFFNSKLYDLCIYFRNLNLDNLFKIHFNIALIKKLFNQICIITTVKAFVVTPSENYGIFCHLGGYDKGFFGNKIIAN